MQLRLREIDEGLMDGAVPADGEGICITFQQSFPVACSALVLMQ